ncbi:MAG: peptide deformylase [Clostridiales bacterium]|nr:peptide deformylase [Clostridiales bacterium]
MALREIKHFERDKILRKKSRPVDEVNERIHNLLDDMAETMYHVGGVGLAAPQVGVLRRVVIIDIGEGLLELINPEVVEVNGEQIADEGCLSVPGWTGQVKRPANVTVTGLDREGNRIKITGNDLLARAICHEVDHLDGVLYIDKVEPDTLMRLEEKTD